MYISIEKNSRGEFEINQTAFNKILHLTVTNNLAKEFKGKDIWINTEIYQDNFLYILIKFTLPNSLKSTEINEKEIIRQVENLTLQTFNTKPKNIALAYSRK